MAKEESKEVTTAIQRLKEWVAYRGRERRVWFRADEVAAIRETEIPGSMATEIQMKEGWSFVIREDAELVWKAVAGPATDDAVSLNASLGKPQEQP